MAPATRGMTGRSTTDCWRFAVWWGRIIPADGGCVCPRASYLVTHPRRRTERVPAGLSDSAGTVRPAQMVRWGPGQDAVDDVGAVEPGDHRRAAGHGRRLGPAD